MDDFDDLAADPVLGPIVRDIRATRAELTEAKAHLREQGDRIKNHEDTWIKSGYESQLHGLAAHHRGRYKKDLDRERFIGFAVQRGITDLGVAYRAFSLDDERELVTREAEERGALRGRA